MREHLDEAGMGSERDIKTWNVTDFLPQVRHISVDFNCPCKKKFSK